MNAKHTPGPWTRNRAINTVDMGRYSVICPFGADSKKHVSEIDANMRIIAAAPDGLKVAQDTYLALLQLDNVWRIKNQDIYCGLRDFISNATGVDAETVQDEFEYRAAIAKAKGE